MATQIKTGLSEFREQVPEGWFYRPKKHKNVEYWLRYPMPVLIMLVNHIDRRVLWQHVSRTTTQSAGTGWKWSDPVTEDGTKVLVPDVRIGDWHRPWNAKPEQRVPDVPASHFWTSDERGFGQVGCIYTAQGFEYDWAGVIFGNDFVWRGDHWEARREHSHDPAVKKADELHFARLIRNTYKVLLTRGMRGVCVYSEDQETQDHLRSIAL